MQVRPGPWHFKPMGVHPRLQHGQATHDDWQNAKRGKLLAAAKNVFDRRNFTALKAIREDLSRSSPVGALSD